MADIHTSSSTKWWIGGVLAMGAVFGAISGWSWARAWWIYPDLTDAQRIENFNEALVARRNGAGVIARPERGGLTILGRGDVAQVGASQCVREMACQSYLPLPLRNDPGLACLYVGVRFSCAYAIKTADGNAATAYAKFESNRRYEMGVSTPGSAKPLDVGEPRFHMLDEPDFQAANETLCRSAVGCVPATGTQPGAQAQTVSAKAEPSRPPSADATGRREFQDCHNGFCGPAMVVLPKGRSVRGSSTADIERLLKDDPRTSRDIFKDDPFWTNGMRASVRINRWVKAFPDRKTPV